MIPEIIIVEPATQDHAASRRRITTFRIRSWKSAKVSVGCRQWRPASLGSRLPETNLRRCDSVGYWATNDF